MFDRTRHNTQNTHLCYGNAQNFISFSIVIMVIAPIHTGLYTDLVGTFNAPDDQNPQIFVRIQDRIWSSASISGTAPFQRIEKTHGRHKQ